MRDCSSSFSAPNLFSSALEAPPIRRIKSAVKDFSAELDEQRTRSISTYDYEQRSSMIGRVASCSIVEQGRVLEHRLSIVTFGRQHEKLERLVERQFTRHSLSRSNLTSLSRKDSVSEDSEHEELDPELTTSLGRRLFKGVITTAFIALAAWLLLTRTDDLLRLVSRFEELAKYVSMHPPALVVLFVVNALLEASLFLSTVSHIFHYFVVCLLSSSGRSVVGYPSLPLHHLSPHFPLFPCYHMLFP